MRIVEKIEKLFLLVISLSIMIAILVSYIPFAKNFPMEYYLIFLAGITIGIGLYIYRKVVE